jgi:hypothetical protein
VCAVPENDVDNLVLLAVATGGQTPADVRKFLLDNRYTFEVPFDTAFAAWEDSLGKEMTTFVIGRRGAVTNIFTHRWRRHPGQRLLYEVRKAAECNRRILHRVRGPAHVGGQYRLGESDGPFKDSSEISMSKEDIDAQQEFHHGPNSRFDGSRRSFSRQRQGLWQRKSIVWL